MGWIQINAAPVTVSDWEAKTHASAIISLLMKIVRINVQVSWRNLVYKVVTSHANYAMVQETLIAFNATRYKVDISKIIHAFVTKDILRFKISLKVSEYYMKYFKVGDL
jgi:hypothetical protein